VIKVSDAISNFLSELGLNTVFGVTGGASIHLMHSFEKNPQLKMVACHHEQGASMAADGYARATGFFGCAVATSGPGATNLITGILGAWCDSVPILFLTGQVATFRQKGDLQVRQYGFQETDIVSMVKGITKFAIQVRNSTEVIPSLHKAVQEMFFGRPGPVLIDIPDDIQRQLIDENILPSFNKETLFRKENLYQSQSALIPQIEIRNIEKLIQLLSEAKRPVFIIGSGSKSNLAREQINEFIENHDLPVLTTWGAKDVIASSYLWNCGTFGTHGTRLGNFVVQNSDLIVSLGSRLSTKETGTPVSDFARSATLVMVDIDENEINKFEKFGKRVDIAFNSKVEALLPLLAKKLTSDLSDSFHDWKLQIKTWRASFPLMELNLDKEQSQGLTSIEFVECVQAFITENTDIYVDTGCAVAWLMQGLQLPVGARIFHDCNNTAMGWALPASIGGKEASPTRDVICIVGDGSIMMNVQELSTLKHLGQAIKVFLIDNAGYAMVRQTEQQWLEGRHVGTGVSKNGLSFPDFTDLFHAFGLNSVKIHSSKQFQMILSTDSVFCAFVFIIDPRCGVFPQVSFGFPLEDAEPLLKRQIFMKNMIIEPKEISQGQM
jgi:acetolactate synthase-1/2/3 large subunit